MEFLSQEEIDALLDIAEQGEYSEYTECGDDVTTIKYNPLLQELKYNLPKGFYRSPNGYKTLEEAKFRYYNSEIETLTKSIDDCYLEIDTLKEYISKRSVEIQNIYNDQKELFEMFSEELL